MKVFCKGIIITLISLVATIKGGQKANFDYQFAQDDSGYSFYGSFLVKANSECLMQVIFDFKHIAQYATGAQSIELARQGENWNEVTYTYRKFLIFENQSTWRRTLKRDEQKVVFEMISSQNNLAIMPQVLSSSGYYQIQPENTGYRIKYFQMCRLKTGLLKDAYINQAKHEAIKFLHEFNEYIEKTCY
jgi:hypothetical protein